MRNILQKNILENWDSNMNMCVARIVNKWQIQTFAWRGGWGGGQLAAPEIILRPSPLAETDDPHFFDKSIRKICFFTINYDFFCPIPHFEYN